MPSYDILITFFYNSKEREKSFFLSKVSNDLNFSKDIPKFPTKTMNTIYLQRTASSLYFFNL